ncbi:MAG: ABC transporter ATP-binding protein [Candidatus Omnitrophica bacterium]|nr:ABC transporter ATP-binding protein [Candidatus Omnitrophota bacterium]
MKNDIIDVKNVTKCFGSKKVLDDLSFQVGQGSVFGLLGKNGSGKTTLIKSILGLVRPQHGNITTLGDDPWCFQESTKEKIGYVPQMDSLYPWLRIKEMVEYTASFYSRWNSNLVNELIEDWGLNPQDRIGTLSVGESQKVSIILSLGHEPELLVFDEPVASLDPFARRQFLKTLIEIITRRPCTIFFSTHITSDLERITDHVALLHQGKIMFCGELDELKTRGNLNLEEIFLEMTR